MPEEAERYSDNMIENPCFENDLSGWDSSDATTVEGGTCPEEDPSNTAEVEGYIEQELPVPFSPQDFKFNADFLPEFLEVGKQAQAGQPEWAAQPALVTFLLEYGDGTTEEYTVPVRFDTDKGDARWV